MHVAVGSTLIGAEQICLSDFSGLSSRVAIYSSSDDYSGATMTNPTVPSDYKGFQSAPVRVGRHVIVPSGTVILPGVTLGQGVAVGALSLVTKSCEDFWIYAGNPVKPIKKRKLDMLELERNLLESRIPP